MNTAIEEERPMCRPEGVPEPDRLREFALAALSHDAVDDAVTGLLFEHVVEGRYHPSVIAAELPRLLEEVLGAATLADWQALAGLLVSEQGSAAQAAQSGGGERRVTALGTRIDVGLIREFLWLALTHPAAAPRLEAALAEGKEGVHPWVFATSLRRVVEGLLRALGEEDWNVITGQLIAEARALDGEV